jgi:hypothetical protein
MKRQWPMLVLCVLGLLALPGIAQACDCVREYVPSPEQFGPRDVVFLGRVVHAQPLAYVDLDVLETFNGRMERRVRIPTGRSDCDYFLPPLVTASGTQFLVYATILDDGTLAVNRCAGSGPVHRKTDDLERLRQRAHDQPKQ